MHRHIHKAPRWRFRLGKQLRITPRNPVRREKRRSAAHPGRNTLAGAGQDAHRNGLGNLTPVLPKVELRQIISPHQPDKSNLGVTLTQLCKGLSGVAGAQRGLDIGDLHTRMLHHLPRSFHPFAQGRWPPFLKRVSRTDQPPNLIKTKPFERLTGDMHMPCMGRIKRSAQ